MQKYQTELELIEFKYTQLVEKLGTKDVALDNNQKLKIYFQFAEEMGSLLAHSLHNYGGDGNFIDTAMKISKEVSIRFQIKLLNQ